MLATDRSPIWLKFKRRRARADSILSHFDVTHPAVDIEAIARGLDVPVLTVRQPGWSGAVDSDELSGRATIWVAAEETPFRRRFTIAHELGHLILHPSGQAYRDRFDFSGSRVEAQANGYAAALLMPLWMLDEYASRYNGNVSLLADIFKVSDAAMAIRLGKLAGG